MHHRKISPAEPVTELRRVKIVESGEPMVDFLSLDPNLILDRPRFLYRRETQLRVSVAERLVEANRNLLKVGYSIRIIEGWRPPFIQRRMYAAIWNRLQARHPDWSETRLRRLVNQFSAPMNPRVPPPHTTGAAVDVALNHLDGTPADMQGPYDRSDPKGFVANAPLLGEVARQNRLILKEAMAPTGITNYPSEFWHWSYGDQGWAYRGGHENAIYGPVEPEGWIPHAEDDHAGPLIFVDSSPANE